MNAPIQAVYTVGQNLYAVIFGNVDGKAWNQTDQVWEAYASGHWAKYAVALVEYANSGYYRATYPVPAGSLSQLTTEVIFLRAGGTPTLGDTPATGLYQSQGSNVGAVGNAWQSAQNMGNALGAEQAGAISGTPGSATLLPTNLASTAADAYAGAAIILTSGALIQQRSFVTGYDGAGNLQIQGFPSGGTPANGDLFILV